MKEVLVVSNKKKQKKEIKTKEQEAEEIKNLTMMNFPKFKIFIGELAKMMFPWD